MVERGLRNEFVASRHQWSPTWLRVFVYALLAVQLTQGSLHTSNGFVQSYWLVNYNQGFIRRGLTGAFLEWLVGTPTAASIAIASLCVAAVSVAAVLTVIELLLHLRTSAGSALAVLLACSPFVIDQMVYQRRPDQLGVLALVWLGLALVYTRRWRAAHCMAAGLLFGALCLVHEGIALYNLPIAVALTVLVTQREIGPRQLCALVSALVIPSLLAVASALAFGTRSMAAVQRLRTAAPVKVNGSSMFDFLGDSAVDSLRHVLDARHGAQLGMLVLGFALIFVHWAWLVHDVHVELFQQLHNTVAHVPRLALLVAIASGALATFLLGVDWLRWFAELGTAWLLAGAFLLLHQYRTNDAATSRSRSAGVALPLWLPLLALYLTALAPLKESLGLKGILAYLVPNVR